MKKNQNSNGVRCSIPQLRGVNARRWRKKLASSAIRPADTVRTLKFKLDLPTDAAISFNNVRALNKIVDGTGKGSLTGLLLAAHCSGFQIFAQEAGARRFRESQDNSNDAFRTAFQLASGFTIEGFDPAGIYERFAKRPRARAGKDIRFIPEIIAAEYARHFTGKKIGDLESPLAQFFSSIGDALHREFHTETDGWASIEADPYRAAATLDAVIHDRGWHVPRIARQDASSDSNIWPSCVLAHDSKQPILDPFSSTSLYAIVALRIAQLKQQGVQFGEKIRAKLQAAITTETSGGLSWLFGAGLNRLRESDDIASVARGLGVPAEGIDGVRQLVDAAKAIGADPLFNAKGFADYRRLVGGRLDSWVANYVNRLLQLSALLEVPAQRFILPQTLVSDWQKWFGKTPIRPDELQALLDEAYNLRQPAAHSLGALTGETGEFVTPEIVAVIHRYTDVVSEANGALRLLAKVLAPDDGDGAERDPMAPSAGLLKAPEWLADLPKLNDFSGAIPDFEAELDEAANAFNKLGNAYQYAIGKIHTERFGNGKAFGAQTLQKLTETALRDARTATTPADARELAIRQVLQRFAKVAIACGDDCAMLIRDLYIQWGVFKSLKDANRLFINRNGSLYRSPYSRGRHEPYELGELTIDADRIVAELRNFTASLSVSDSRPEGMNETSVLRLQQSADALSLIGLTDSCPREWFENLLDRKYVRVPLSTQLAMQESNWRPELVSRYLNLLLAARLSVRSVLERRQFFVRARFQRVGDTQLCYKPKNVIWHIPERLLITTKPIGDAARALSEGGTLDPGKTLEKAIKTNWADRNSLTHYLQQTPHDWFFVPGLPSAENTGGWLVVDGKVGKAAKLSRQGLAGRLIGPPSYKTELDRLLQDNSPVSFGDVTLIIDQEFNQTLKRGSDGSLSSAVTEGAMTVSIAIPLKTAALEPTEFAYADRVVAIDQGEAGIGFAVFDVKTKALIESGHRRIPSIRRLIGKAKQYRSVGQKSQKFQQRFDSTLFNMRENVVGDVAHVVCQLMNGYRAFPALESQVGNLEGGSRQLDLVYKAVTARFCYSDVPAQNTDRIAFWQGGERWQHPFLLSETWNDGKRTGKTKPLNLFPGVKAPTAGTSQQCSVCKCNPIRELRDILEGGKKTMVVGQAGTVSLPSGEIALYRTTTDRTQQARAWRRNERLALDQPIDPGERLTVDILTVARRNLRQAPRSRQSRDTTQSVYQCLFVKCRHTMQADENAARNIGRRFLEEKVTYAENA